MTSNSLSSRPLDSGKRFLQQQSRARQAVHKAVVSGKLIKKDCERCGNPNSEAHHEDYNKPLSVIWLCRWCHKQCHLKHSDVKIRHSPIKSGVKLTYITMAIFIPFINGCYSISDKVSKQPQKLVLMKAMSSDNVAVPMSYVWWTWDDTREGTNRTPVEFDLLSTTDLINWTLVYRGPLSNQFIPRLDSQFIKVGVHEK